MCLGRLGVGTWNFLFKPAGLPLAIYYGVDVNNAMFQEQCGFCEHAFPDQSSRAVPTRVFRVRLHLYASQSCTRFTVMTPLPGQPCP